MPGKDVLPPGPKRDFVSELYVHYREAGRPPLPEIAARTGKQAPAASRKVSRETIRRLLTGTTTSQWAVVDAVFRALCEMQGRDPDGRRWPESEDDRWDDSPPATCREHLRRLWNNDIDGLDRDEEPSAPPAAPVPAAPEVPQPRKGGGWGGTAAPADDPWATGAPLKAPAQSGGYSDEPPF
ncbi:hypothetical protein [Streptomyces sp. NPDC060187]|uniref:hypothetical protein n=1 Tax=Streptomyces sp. NPDC060187 TaxID=3347067 RepID=UPI0036562C24